MLRRKVDLHNENLLIRKVCLNLLFTESLLSIYVVIFILCLLLVLFSVFTVASVQLKLKFACAVVIELLAKNPDVL